jgi:hypothetical protein
VTHRRRLALRSSVFRMFYRDMTRAAPTAQSVVDLSMADGTALDALTVYLMRYEHIRECTDCGPKDASKVTA